MTIRESRIRLSLASLNFDPAGTVVPPGFFMLSLLCGDAMLQLSLSPNTQAGTVMCPAQKPEIV